MVSHRVSILAQMKGEGKTILHNLYAIVALGFVVVVVIFVVIVVVNVVIDAPGSYHKVNRR